jgi:hypothetical protein
MSTQETGVSKAVSTAVTPSTSHTDSAQERLQDLRQMRDLIPRFLIPASPRDRTRLNSAASVPPEFVELAAVGVANEKSLVRGDGLTPAEIRDLTGYADAYGPFADELEAFAQFVRHSVTAARNKAGSEAADDVLADAAPGETARDRAPGAARRRHAPRPRTHASEADGRGAEAPRGGEGGGEGRPADAEAVVR